MPDDPLLQWADVTEWVGEVSCVLRDDHDVFSSGNVVAGFSHLLAEYRASIQLSGVHFSWSGAADAAGFWTERTEVDASGAGFVELDNETVDGSGGGTESAFLSFAVDVSTNRGVYSLESSSLDLGATMVVSHYTSSGLPSDPGSEVTGSSAVTRSVFFPGVDNADLPSSGLVLEGTERLELVGTLVANLSWRLEPVATPTPQPAPCGATLLVLDSQNRRIDPASEALGVSNHVSDDSRLVPTTIGFDGQADDRKAFRFEVEDPVAGAGGASVEVALEVGGRPPTIYQLQQRSGDRHRGPFLRLVTDKEDRDALGNNQNVICKLGEEVIVRYTNPPASACEDQYRIRIGRPETEDNNAHPFHFRHDIRRLALNVVVFSMHAETTLNGRIDQTRERIKVAGKIADAHKSGYLRIGNEVIEYTGKQEKTREFTGCTRGADGTVAANHSHRRHVLYSTTIPVATRADVKADLDTVDERFAQSGIVLSQPVSINIGFGLGADLIEGPGVVLPGALLKAYVESEAAFGTAAGEILPPASETAVAALKDANPNSVDVFYIQSIAGPNGVALGGAARPASFNNTGNDAFQNFIVLSPIRNPLTIAHELLHILLNTGHESQYPTTALFFNATGDDKAVRSPKRIGPYPEAESSGIGIHDTEIIRAVAESLPT